MHIDHFTYGALTPGFSYALSVLGSFLGLFCTVRARGVTDRARKARWLLLAAWAIGGTGIWVMHFMAMIGFSVGSAPVRYDPAITVASWIIAIVTVGIGLFIVGFGRPSVIKVLSGGLFAGVGVAAMHYTGMAAMRLPATVTYDRTLVIASVVIAVVAATVALWFTVTLKRGPIITVAALIMGVAVNGMHFTGMFAMRVSEFQTKPVSGLPAMSFIAPIVVFVLAVAVVLAAALISRAGTDEGRGGGGRAVGPTDLAGARQNLTTAFGNRRPATR